MPVVYFMAWINGNDGNDPGHLVMVTVLTDGKTKKVSKICLEYAREGEENYSESVGKKLQPKEKEKAATEGPKAKPAQNLKVSQDDIAKSIKVQKEKEWKGKTRFTHVLITNEFEVTQEELDYMKKMAALRIAKGAYYFLKEAKVFDPLVARCLSSLEDLTGLRKQKLDVGNADAMLEQFAKQNKVAYNKVAVKDVK